MPANTYSTPLEGRERVRQSSKSCQVVWNLEVKVISLREQRKQMRLDEPKRGVH